MNEFLLVLTRIADALERLAPPPPDARDIGQGDAFLWDGAENRVTMVVQTARVGLNQLLGIERQKETLLRNTMQFAHGLPANNALLWGAKGTGKSALVKAVHAAANELEPGALALLEIPRGDIATLPRLMTALRGSGRKFLLFCDDLSFEHDDGAYKSLKTVLDGGIAGRPDNMLLYATSNRRHLMARDLIDNERSTAINPSEAVNEKVSLSDRFGLWLGFHNIDQETYFEIVEGYTRDFGLALEADTLRREANEWAITRGARSGRVAWQFVQDLRGRA